MKWNENTSGRNGRTLNIPKVKGVSQMSKTLRRNSIQYYGVKLMNILPTEIRNFKGKPDIFKNLLDSFLKCVPDQPETDSLIPSVTDFYGSPSNSVYDWCNSVTISWEPSVDLIREGENYVFKEKYDQSMGRLSQSIYKSTKISYHTKYIHIKRI